MPGVKEGKTNLTLLIKLFDVDIYELNTSPSVKIYRP
jgi:hypothetical protein